MKRLLPVLAFAIMPFTLAAQETHSIEFESTPALIESCKDTDIPIFGLSPTAKYAWGTSMYGVSMKYDVVKDKFEVIGKDQDPNNPVRYSIVSITDDGDMLVNAGDEQSYILKLDGTKIEFKSTLDDFPWVSAWHMTPDGGVVVGNFGNESFAQRPFVAVRQEGGTYKTTLLEFEVMDAMGAEAAYSLAHIVTADGKNIVGKQQDNTGFISRLIVWELQEDGTYKYTTPIDDFLFDLTQEKPGPMPEYEDYVTSEDYDSEEYKNQYDAYNKAFDVYYDKMNKFTHNYSTIDGYAFAITTVGSQIMTTYTLSEGDEDMTTHTTPFIYDCDTKKIINITAIENRLPHNIFPNNEYVVVNSEGYNKYQTWVINMQGEEVTLKDWFVNNTGVDLTEAYQFAYNDETELFIGLPCYSSDGKTMITSLFDYNTSKFISVMMTFKENFFGKQNANDKIDIESVVMCDGRSIRTIGDGGAYFAKIYNQQGLLCTSLQSDESGYVSLENSSLPSGLYVISLQYGDSSKNVSIKASIK